MNVDGDFSYIERNSGRLPSSEIVVYVPFVDEWPTMSIIFTGEVERRVTGESITPVWNAFVGTVTRMDLESD
jgi:hypothetical protein